MSEPEHTRDTKGSVIRADVGIIGAGPAGLATAVHLGHLGVNRVTIVDRADFPRNKTCGSAVSPKGCEVLKACGVEEAVAREAYTINGLRLVTPGLHDLVLSSPQDVALVCNRRTLDHLLLKRAQQTGCQFLPNFDVCFLLQRGDRVVGFRGTDGREVRADYTVVADGAHSRFGLDRGPRHLIQAIMGWWDDVPFRPNHVEMIFDNLLAPYYGWLFPERSNRVNIGICYEDPTLARNARQLFQSFLDKHYGARLSRARQVGSWKGHPISYATSLAKVTSPGRIVVGEAARMTHPATAEGIYQGMRSGMLAAQALCGILQGGVEPPRALRDYEATCRKAFGMSFRGAGLWRHFVTTGALDVVAGMLDRPMSRRLIARCMAQM
jgi:geranylgeranyl reductase family protein